VVGYAYDLFYKCRLRASVFSALSDALLLYDALTGVPYPDPKKRLYVRFTPYLKGMLKREGAPEEVRLAKVIMKMKRKIARLKKKKGK
jgi:hypothetical protein